MNNTEHFGKLTERMQAFREEVLDAKPYIDAQRAVLATEAYKENQNQPRVMVRALMLQKILEGMSIYIDDKSLIAGNQATKNKNAPIFPEYNRCLWNGRKIKCWRCPSGSELPENLI